MEKLRRIVNIVIPSVMLLNTCLNVALGAGWKYIFYTVLAAGWGACIGLEVGRILTLPRQEEKKLKASEQNDGEAQQR